MLKNRLFTSVFMMLAMAGVANAATLEIPENHFVEQDLEGCYLLKDKFDLYWFANKVNTENTTYATSCAKLTADIVVNEHVLKTAEGKSNVCENGVPNDCVDGVYIGDASGFHEWTPIGYSGHPFIGTFDGQGYTISGLYFNDLDGVNVGLFGYVGSAEETVSETVSISNVGVEDSYFKANSAVGGVVGFVENAALDMKNVYNAAVVVGASFVGGIVGYVSLYDPLTLSMVNVYNVGSVIGSEEGQTGGLVGDFMNDSEKSKITIENSYNYGNVDGGSPLVGCVEIEYENVENVSVTNSYYLGEAAQGDYGTAKFDADFSNGTVYAALHGAEDGSVWHWYSGDAYPTFVEKHSVTLHYSATESETIYFAEGAATPLPTADGNENIVAGWYVNPDFTGTKYSEIPATATSDLEFYSKKMNLVDGYYEIADADMLFKFAELVNTQNSKYGSAKAKLIADIVVNQNVLGTNNANVEANGAYNNAQAASAFRVWTPIGTSSTSSFKGTFNGKGHTISGLYFNNSETDNVGLFGYTSGAVTIDSVGVVDSYFRGSQYVGGLVGYCNKQGTLKLSVKNSYNTGSVNGTNNVGGLVGGNASSQSFNVENSYNTGSVNGNQYVGGLVGKGGEIKFSYNIGPVNGSAYAGGLAGSGNSITDSYNTGLVKNGEALGSAMIGYDCDQADVSSKISNSYYLEGSGNSCGPNAFSGTTSEFANGLIAIKLHQFDTKNIGNGSVWGQVVGTDKTPTLTGEIRFLLKDGCFEIASKEDLYLFAAVVNNDFDPDACGKLTADIKVNEHVLANVNADGSLKDGVNFKEWTPIGNRDNPFQGTFHGQGHTISGLYFNDTGAEDVGLFGDVNGTVTIDSVGLVDSYIMAGSYVGGLVGFARGSLTISNSYNASSVTSYTFGGLVGAASKNSSSLIISNSYNVGSLNGQGYGGGLVGYAYALVVSNSYNAGSIYNSENGAHVGGITSSVDDASTVTNSFNYGTISYPSNIEVVVDDLVAEGGKGEVTVTNSFSIGESRFKGNGSTKMSSTEFADGTVYAALHSAEGGEDWLQYAGDAYPTLVEKTGTGASAPMHVAVLHYSETDSVVIAYTEGETLTLPTEDNGGNPIAGWTTSADGTGDAITEIPTSATTDLKLYAKVETFKPNAEGYYEIATADDLYKFAEIVNSGAVTNAKAKLTADICVNACGEGESVLGTDNANVNANGDYIGSTTGLREWIPIGFGKDNENIVSFNGLFDGQGHTISGLYCEDDDRNYIGLFGILSTATIKNVGVEDSYFKGFHYIGGILGLVDEYANVNIENVYNAAVVVGENGAGGIIGGDFGNESHVTNAYNVGMVLSINETAGGIVGYNYSVEPTTIQNSFNYGSVSAGSGTAGALIGAVEDEYDDAAGFSVTNSFYLGDAAQGDYGTVKSSTEFSDGTVFAALHSAEGGEGWLQYAGDDYPTLVAKTGTGAPAPMHVATLHYSDTDSTFIAYVEGIGDELPTEDKDGNAIIGWTASADGTGDVITEIPASATTDLKLYPKFNSFEPNADGYYEITSADDLYKFAELVNSGKERDAKAKLMNDIVVNENVLATAGGASNVDATTGEYTNASAAAGFREWTPIGIHGNAFKGAFDGQGYTISGLYFNDSEAEYVGLFGYVLGYVKNPAIEVSIANVGVEDSYFNGKNYVGGVIGSAECGVALDFENIYSTAVVVGTSYVGGFAGEIAVGDGSADATLNMTNAYHSGSVIGSSNVGGLVGILDDMTSATIKNAYSYDENVALLGRVGNGSNTPTVTNSYYLADETSGSYGSNASASDFENGTVLAALRAGEGGYVWVQAEGDKYPTIDINASKNANTVVLAWTTAADSTTLADKGYTEGAMVIVKSGKKFYADGAIYEGILSADQVAAIGRNKLYPISGVKLETVNDKLVATLDGDSQDAVMIPTDVHVDKVVYKRNVQANTFCTIMLPFTVPVAAVSDHSFYKFRRVATDDPDYSYVVKVTSVTTTLKANRPYIMIDSKGSSQIEFVNVEGGLTLNTTAESYEASSTADGITWKMKGVYEYKQWQTGDSEIGRAYLFTAQALGKYEIGQFAKLASGASLRPMRMYLTAETSSPNGGLNRPSRYGISSIVMPENIGIEIEDEELDESVEETTVVKRITIVPMLVQSNRWFDMKGRALNGRPTAKGTYYYNGKRIIIK